MILVGIYNEKKSGGLLFLIVGLTSRANITSLENSKNPESHDGRLEDDRGLAPFLSEPGLTAVTF